MNMLRKVLLVCGVLSSLVYVAADVTGARCWAGYSPLSQTISELSAIGAPSRSAWMPLGIAYDVLLVAFALGVWRSAGPKVTASLLLAIGALGLFWPPMHMRGSPATLTDTLHVVFASAVSLLILAAVGFGAGALGRAFRRYSIATLLALIGLGVSTFLYAPRLAANLPTPGLGLIERLNLGVYLLWVAVLAVGLLRAGGARARRPATGARAPEKEVTMRALPFAPVLLLALAGPALAAEPAEGEAGLDRAVPTVVPALEITIAGGYSQGVGAIGDQMDRVQDLSGAGSLGELKLGYRPIAPLALGVFGSCARHGTGDKVTMSATATSATAGVYADWHVRPQRALDPWVGLATGWRGLWVLPDQGKSTSLQGLEIARLQVGLDYRITPRIAIAPVVGASLSVFLTQDAPTTTGFESIAGPSPSFFFFGGLLARFDLFGTPQGAPIP
jgi:hypothetical protein